MWKAERAGVDWKFLSGGFWTTAEAPAMQCQSVTVTQNLHDQGDGYDDDDGGNLGDDDYHVANDDDGEFRDEDI